MSDADYTAQVDARIYQDFVHDSAGYGLAQWTFWSRKQKLLVFALSRGKSIGDLEMQLDFLWKELTELSISGQHLEDRRICPGGLRRRAGTV